MTIISQNTPRGNSAGLRSYDTLSDSPIVRIADMGEVIKVKAAIIETYGFEPTEEYCRDLVKFVLALTGGRHVQGK